MTLYTPRPELEGTSPWKSFFARVALAPDEEVVLLHDATVFGSGSQGIAVTSQRVIGLDGKRVQNIPLREIIYAEPRALPSTFVELVLHRTSGPPVTLAMAAGLSETGQLVDAI